MVASHGATVLPEVLPVPLQFEVGLLGMGELEHPTLELTLELLQESVVGVFITGLLGHEGHETLGMVIEFLELGQVRRIGDLEGLLEL